MQKLTSPRHWFMAGSAPEKYVAVVDPSAAHDGCSSAKLESDSALPETFGTLMQWCLPGQFAGRRLRMSAFARVEDVDEWAGLWLRIDSETGTQSLGFDNMEDRPLKGSTPWKRYEIVLDVPRDAAGIAFGVLLSGRGRAWVNQFRLDAVGLEVPTTGGCMASCLASEPLNLDFAQVEETTE